MNSAFESEKTVRVLDIFKLGPSFGERMLVENLRTWRVSMPVEYSVNDDRASPLVVSSRLSWDADVKRNMPEVST
jgi:hypothetical protein